MPTEIEDQIRNYFEWVETRTGHNLRPPLANNPDRAAPVGAVSRLQVESPTALRVDTAQTRTPRPRAGRFPILLAAAATIAVVAGLAVIGSYRGESPTPPATQPTDPEQAEVAPLPGWEGNLAMKIYMNPNATDTQLELVDQTLANASDLIAAWTYLDADASLQEAERILADEPGTFELLNPDNVITTFNLVANPAAPAASLRQLAAALQQLPGVYDVITQDQARRQSPSGPTEQQDQDDPPITTASPSTNTETTLATSIVEIDWANPPRATTFDEPDDFTRHFDLVLQGEIDQCMTAAGFEYRRSPAPDSPSAVLDEWQTWANGQADQDGWNDQRTKCADAFVMSDWYGEVNALNYIAQASNQWGGNIAAIYQRPDMIEATRAIVDCARDAGIEISADPATNTREASDQVWTAFNGQVEAAMEAIPDNDLSGIEQMDQFRLDRAAAIDSVCPALSASERVLNNAQREDETAWLKAHPDIAQRINDEWADDITQLQAILKTQPD